MLDETNHDVIVIDAFFGKKLIQRLEFDNFSCLWDCLLWNLTHLSCNDNMTHSSRLFHFNLLNMSEKLFLR